MERLATLRLSPRRLNLMADLRRRRYYKNGMLDAPTGERFRSKDPVLRAFNREFRRLFSEWKVWEIHRTSVCPVLGHETIELCHLWRFRQVAPSQWVMEHRQLTSRSGQSSWVQGQGSGTFPELHLWPFNRRETTRASRLRFAVWDHLALFALRNVMRRLGARKAPDIGRLRKIVFKRWERGILRNDRTLMGLRCFVNDMWKRVLTPGDFSRLVAMRGFSPGVSTTDVAAYVRSRPHFVQWDAHPNLWPMVGQWLNCRFQGALLVEQVTPANLHQWVMGPQARAQRKRWEDPRGYPFPKANSKREFEAFLSSPPSLVKAVFRSFKKNLSYWSMDKEVLDALTDLPLTDRAVLVEWAAGFRNWRGWRPLVQRVALRYQLSRMGHKPLRGRWPDASFGAAAFRLRTQVHEVVYLFRKPPKGAALEAWEEALPNDHLWRLENRRNGLEEVLAVPTDEAPKKRSRF